MANHFYHYTTGETLESIFGEPGSKDLSYSDNGLMPVRRFVGLELFYAMRDTGYTLPEEVQDGVSYGFLTQLPEQWLIKEPYNTRSHFDDVIGSIYGSDDIALLKINVGKDDEVYVVDHGVFSDGVEKYRADPENELKHFYGAWQSYWESRVRLSDYDPQKHPMRRPEVVCFSRIPTSRVQVLQIIERNKLKYEAAVAAGDDVVPLPVQKQTPDDALGFLEDAAVIEEPQDASSTATILSFPKPS